MEDVPTSVPTTLAVLSAPAELGTILLTTFLDVMVSLQL